MLLRKYCSLDQSFISIPQVVLELPLGKKDLQKKFLRNKFLRNFFRGYIGNDTSYQKLCDFQRKCSKIGYNL